jgi:nucleoid DNA-binding protein
MGRQVLTKADLVVELCKRCELSLFDAREVVDLTFAYIKDMLRAGERVMIPHFGIFHIVEKRAWTKHLSDGRTIDLPATRIVKFKAGKGLKAKIQ